MILENLSKEELLDLAKKHLIQVKKDYKTLKKDEWYEGWQDEEGVTIKDDYGDYIDLSYDLCEEILK